MTTLTCAATCSGKTLLQLAVVGQRYWHLDSRQTCCSWLWCANAIGTWIADNTCCSWLCWANAAGSWIADLHLAVFVNTIGSLVTLMNYWRHVYEQQTLGCRQQVLWRSGMKQARQCKTTTGCWLNRLALPVNGPTVR